MTRMIESARAEATARACVKAALRRGACVLALTFGVSAVSGVAQAQEGEEATGSERIVVTGSRISRTTDFNSPQPTTVFDGEYLESLGIVNLGTAVAQLPANVSAFQPTTTGNGNFFTGSTIANLRGLNPFFGSRTLTMVDTRRHVPTNQGDGVDLNFIPSILIDRVETVTGGASAAYGSGAISGVQNILLDRDLEGAKFQADYGVTGEGDGEDVHVAAAYGAIFGDGRGNLVVGAEHQDSEAVGCNEARDWCAQNRGLLTNNYFDFGTFTTQLIDPSLGVLNAFASNLHVNQRSYTGVFVNSFTDGTNTAVYQANAAGTGVTAFDLGDTPAHSARLVDAFFGGGPVVGGDGIEAYEYTNLRSPVERTIVNAAVDYDLTDSVTFFLEGSTGEVVSRNETGALDHNDGTVGSINCADNYWVTEATLNTACIGSMSPFNPFTNPTPAGRVRKDWTSQVDAYTEFTTEVWRVATGFNGDFGNGWVWDAYFSYGQTDRTQFLSDNRHLNRYLFAIDTVDDGFGNPICRYTRDGITPINVVITPEAAAAIGAGCVPLNPFGSGALDPAAKAYSFGFLREELDYSQRVLAANTSGEVFEGFGAGPIQLAGGVEYRVEKGENIGNAAQQANDFVRQDYLIQYGETFAGDVQVIEAYAELNVPVLADMPGAELLEFNAAVRQSQYTNEGKEGTTGEIRVHDITSHKITGVWDPVTWLRLRGSHSRDIRAGNFRELYYGQFINSGGAFGFVSNPFGCGVPFGGPPCDAANYDLRGNVDVLPEKADTVTGGFVFRPDFGGLDGFEFAADYYDIKLEDSIQQASIQRTLDGCYLGIQEFCDLITFGASQADIVTVIANSFNAPEYRVRGIDYSVGYTTDLPADSTLALRVIASNTLEQRLATIALSGVSAIQDRVGELGSSGFLADIQGTADWRANFTASVSRGPVTVTGQALYVSDGVLDWNATPNEYTSNDIDAHTTFNLNGAYTLGDVDATNVQLFVSVDNITDEEPPFVANGGNGGANAIFHDTLGRSFRFGLRAAF